MLNPDSQWRIELARLITTHYNAEALIAKWQDEIRLLPDALAHKLMRQYAQMWAQRPLRDMLIRRGDVLYANRALNDIAEKVVYLLVVILMLPACPCKSAISQLIVC